MHISWLGSTAFKLQLKPQHEDVTVVIDPYKPGKGSFPRNLASNIAIYTRGTDDSITISGDTFILDTPGECETKGVLMTSVQGNNPNTTMVRIDAEQLSIAHLGLTNELPTDSQLEVLSDVDILFIPVGGINCLEPEKAVKAVNMIEPRVVIPMAYKSDNDPQAAPLEAFLKELGVKADPAEKKVILKKKDLPQEEMMVVTLAKE
ncbi:MAG: hypothetical protein COV59_04775 [Candidatus Magasanikbacteria bacterium CG11_big_fil_rev_8_21_14_0_20_39_34]|uniref:Lactamase n=1 Tax=Candidatus Magasanikbacteria bacterium CG11_big_fil_rev_8_21_14_0_20_39_34 TaxID=1974653 RepID=A0A2H0N4D1_9BACT|nr:MAG: hypothetical protein COV59_04775 [Candidatus Magasanikbacteria bacterium CG11_big_fil_rev_8_21_14_0_20_39_34]